MDYISDWEEETASGLVVVQWTAGWCRKCKKIAPQFASFAASCSEMATFKKCLLQDFEDEAISLGVVSLPCFMVLRDAQVVGLHLGSDWVLAEQAIREFMGLPLVAAGESAGGAETKAEEAAPAPAPTSEDNSSSPVRTESVQLQVTGDLPILNVPLLPGGFPAVASQQDPYDNAQALEIARGLQASILELYGDFLSDDGRQVDYGGMAQSPLFLDYVQRTEALRRVSLAGFSALQRKTFAINVYNALCIHGAVVFDESIRTDLGRFFGGTAYEIGGHKFSLDDLEHGILRGNRPHPSGKVFFSENDPRCAFAVDPDPRIHFALVCGAKSCPPIRVFTEDNLDTGLSLAAQSFCSGEVVVQGSNVELSKLLLWYGADFGEDNAAILRTVADFLPEEKACELRTLIEGEFSVTYREYDWGQNAKPTSHL